MQFRFYTITQFYITSINSNNKKQSLFAYNDVYLIDPHQNIIIFTMLRDDKFFIYLLSNTFLHRLTKYERRAVLDEIIYLRVCVCKRNSFFCKRFSVANIIRILKILNDTRWVNKLHNCHYYQFFWLNLFLIFTANFVRRRAKYRK